VTAAALILFDPSLGAYTATSLSRLGAGVEICRRGHELRVEGIKEAEAMGLPQRSFSRSPDSCQ
jgi:hypothetical protein